MTTTLTRGSRSRASAAAKRLPPTLGPQLCRWMEKNLVHGPGDFFGQPFRLRVFQRAFIYQAYELDENGERLYDEALWGMPKGEGKTEIAAAISCAELGGPVVFSHWDEHGRPVGKRRVSPEIPISAASFEQADHVFGCARVMIKEGPLAPYFHVYDTEIQVKNGPGRMYRVAAVAGTNDGALPTFVVCDEVHEWTGRKERVHLVLSNNRAKRRGSWQLNISTAGWNLQSLLGRMYKKGLRILAGELKASRFLFVWYQAKTKLKDLLDRKKVAKALREANPAADDFVSIEDRLNQLDKIPEWEFRRYFLNEWVDAPETWIPREKWRACLHPHQADHIRRGGIDPMKLPHDGAEVVLALDGTYNGESVAIVGCMLPGQVIPGTIVTGKRDALAHVFVVRAWEKGRDDDWQVSMSEVADELRAACERWNVPFIGLSPDRWPKMSQDLEAEGLPLIEWPTHSASRMVPACAQFFDAVGSGDLTHDGDERLNAHVANAVVKVDGRGPRIAKEHKDSERYIELAVAAVVAYDLVVKAGAGEREWGMI